MWNQQVLESSNKKIVFWNEMPNVRAKSMETSVQSEKKIEIVTF